MNRKSSKLSYRPNPPPSKDGCRSIRGESSSTACSSSEPGGLADDAPRFTSLEDLVSRLPPLGQAEPLGTNPSHGSGHTTAQNQKKASTAAIIDSQSVRTASQAGVGGDDAGKKITGRKRHVLVDIQGNILALKVTTEDVPNRDDVPLLLKVLSMAFGLQQFQGVGGALRALLLGDGECLVFDVGFAQVEQGLAGHGGVFDAVLLRDEREHGLHKRSFPRRAGALDDDARTMLAAADHAHHPRTPKRVSLSA